MLSTMRCTTQKVMSHVAFSPKDCSAQTEVLKRRLSLEAQSDDGVRSADVRRVPARSIWRGRSHAD